MHWLKKDKLKNKIQTKWTPPPMVIWQSFAIGSFRGCSVINWHYCCSNKLYLGNSYVTAETHPALRYRLFISYVFIHIQPYCIACISLNDRFGLLHNSFLVSYLLSKTQYLLFSFIRQAGMRSETTDVWWPGLFLPILLPNFSQPCQTEATALSWWLYLGLNHCKSLTWL